MGTEVVKVEEKREEGVVKIPPKPEKTGPSMLERVQEMAMEGKVGNLVVSDKEAETLFAPVDADAVQIRPDGLVFLTWTFYAKRLRDAFRLQWALIAVDAPKSIGELVTWSFYLSVRGQIVGVPAMGECQYRSGNRTMSWGDAVEGAKSNALMRLAKGIGIGSELWDHEFVEDWRKKHAEQKIVDGKMQWVKKAKVVVTPGIPGEIKKEGGK